MIQTTDFESWALLVALKSNLPNDEKVGEKWVREYHDVLRRLTLPSGVNLNSFLVPAAQIDYKCTGGNYLTGEEYYSEEKYCERSILMMKIDGVINLLEFYSGTEQLSKPPIGFQSH